MKNKRPIFLILIVLTLAGCVLAVAATGGQDADADMEEDPVCLPIIMYHEVKNSNLGKDAISPWDFESDLKYLENRGYTTITMGQLINYVHNGGSLPENPIMLTFDDGYLNNYKYVLPLLKKYNRKIVLSLIVKDTVEFTRTPDSNLNYSHVTWPQLNEMFATGLVEIQNHSYNLHRITKSRYGCAPKKGEEPDAYAEIFTQDIVNAQNMIFEMTGTLPTTFTYPYGKYCAEADAILKELGFRATLSCRYGINKISRDNPDGLFRLKRLCRSHSQNIGSLLDEAYKTIKKKPPSPL